MRNITIFLLLLFTAGCGPNFQSQTPSDPKGPPRGGSGATTDWPIIFLAHNRGIYLDGNDWKTGVGGVTVSFDGGQSWVLREGGANGFDLPYERSWLGMWSIDTDESRIVATFGGGLAISDNEGWTWRSVLSGENGLADGPAVYDAWVDGDFIIAATQGGLSISEDGGYNWRTSVKNQNGFGLTNVVSSVFFDGLNIVATTFGGLNFSSDMGNTWTVKRRLESGLANSHVFYSYAKDDTYTFAGSHQGGISRSVDGGQSWFTTTAGENGFANSNHVWDIAIGKNKVYAATKAGLSISEDFGNSWTTISPGENGFPDNEEVMGIDVKEQYVVVATLNGGIGLSSDGGQTWRTVDNCNGLTSNHVLDAKFR